IARLYFQQGQASHFLSFIIQGHPQMFGVDSQIIWNEALTGQLNLEVEREDYIYSGQILSNIEHQRWGNGYHYDRQERLWRGIYQFWYDAGENLDGIVVQTPAINHTRTTYRKRHAGETLKSIKNQAYSKLITLIPQMIAAQNFIEPLYCLKLQYFET